MVCARLSVKDNLGPETISGARVEIQENVDEY